jgi:uncharacterized protein
VAAHLSDQESAPSGPVDEPHRISALDTIRGFALLGILLMNIIGMGMYGAAYDDPTVTGGSTGLNLWVWIVMHVLAEGKMRCLFSMIFGASVVLLTSRLERRRDAADIYYRRTLWLILFGVAHAYLLWVGDILYPYALCGLALYPFRNLAARRLLVIGTGLLIVSAGTHIETAFQQRETIREGLAAERLEKKGVQLTDEQQDAESDYEQWRELTRPNRRELEKDKKDWQSRNPLHVIATRAKVSSTLHSVPYYAADHVDIWCMMFIGMGLLKLGVLTGERSNRFYALSTLLGYGIGIPVNSFTAYLIVRSHFDPATQEFAGSTYDLGRLTVALGHLGLIMLLVRMGILRRLTRSLAAVGQMAFSNYIFQSVITVIVFTGTGFALYGRLQRYQLYYVVAAIWMFQLVVSPIWLRHFRFGPLEWCWRSLTYWRKQPMRRHPQKQLSAFDPVSAC